MLIYLKKVKNDFKAILHRDYAFLVIVYAYFMFNFISCFFGHITDYISPYTSCLVVSFVLSCIGCRDSGLKIFRFDFQFRMTFAYLTLLLETELAASSSWYMIDENFFNLKLHVFEMLSMLNRGYLNYEGFVCILIEPFFYTLSSPFIYMFACLCFSLKKMMSISIIKLTMGMVILFVNSIIFSIVALIGMSIVNIYIYASALSVYYIILTVLSYAVGKNSFADNAA
ncbi:MULTISPECIES: hypothetical protein [unclassified Maridesulfovibrio]|uniref:hypothetical protein n=1 Tax=unclassified Maridesulfovibrio TaxID=2794999 RepID=UPI003B3D4C0E